MESDFPPEPLPHPSGAQAQYVLRELASDRAALAERLAAPPWLYPLFALLAAGYVATPAIRPDGSRNVAVGILLATSILALTAYQRLSGVRVGRTGTRARVLLVVLLVVTLLSLSTSFGLVSVFSGWWVLAPAAVCFLVVLAGGRWFDRLYREDLGRGR